MLGKQIKETIEKRLGDATIHILNPTGDGVHFEAIVISHQFEGKTLVEQHRMVMEDLKVLFSTSLHALSLKTYTPDQWKNNMRS